MLLNVRKSHTFLFCCCLWTFCAADVFAQENKQPKQNPALESSTEILEPATKVPAVLGKPFIEEPVNARRSASTIDNCEKISVENKSDGEKEIPASLNTDWQEKISELKFNFSRREDRERLTVANETAIGSEKKCSFCPSPVASFKDLKNSVSPDDATVVKAEGFQWRAAIGQSLMFLALQNGYALTQPKTREALKGKFWKDYAKSVKSLRGWDDGGRFFTNYIAHPMQGSFTGFIYVQNDPRALKQQFGASGDYWRSRMKAMAWSAAWSTQFEVGPISQASIGNVGLKGKQTWGDIVITPTVGTAMLVGEDALDRFVTKRLERGTNNFYVRIFSRMLLSPTRTIANVFRFKEPWYRDRPPGR